MSPDGVSPSQCLYTYIWWLDLIYIQFHRWNLFHLLPGTVLFRYHLKCGHEGQVGAFDRLKKKTKTIKNVLSGSLKSSVHKMMVLPFWDRETCTLFHSWRNRSVSDSLISVNATKSQSNWVDCFDRSVFGAKLSHRPPQQRVTTWFDGGVGGGNAGGREHNVTSDQTNRHRLSTLGLEAKNQVKGCPDSN